MRFLKNISIRYKQTFVILLTSAVSLLIASGGFVAYEVLTFRRALVDDVTLLADVIGSNCSAAIDFDDPMSALETLEALRANPHIVSAGVYGTRGNRLAEYGRKRETDVPFPPPAGAPAPGHAFSADFLSLVRPIERHGENIGSIFIASDLDALAPRLRNYIRIAAGVLVVALVVAFIVSSFVQGLITGPIMRLARLTQSVAGDEDYSMRAAGDGNDELGKLIQGFNTMLDRIQERDRELREVRNRLEERVAQRTADLEEANRTIASERARFKFIFDSVAVGISWSENDERTMLVNPAHERLSGIPKEKMHEPSIFAKVTHPDDRARQQEIVEKFRSNQIDRYSLEKRFIHEDGRIVWVEMSARRFQDKETGKLQRVATLVDITERKNIDEKLHRTEELYRRAIAGAGAVPYSLDYRTKNYTFLGEGITDLIGYPPEEVDGKLWREIIQEAQMLGESTGIDKDEAADRVRAGEFGSWACDMRVVTRCGKSRWLFDVSVQNTDGFGNVIGSMGIIQDITERKQAEIAASLYSELAQNLAAATTPIEAARSVGETANKLLGWDAYGVSLYTEDTDIEEGIINIDTVNGKRREYRPCPRRKPSEIARRVFTEGPQLILRDPAGGPAKEAIPFGNASRPSASMMYVPIRHAERIVGLITIQSYTPDAYTAADLTTLQDLADRCAGAIERIRADEARRKSETRFRLVWQISADGMRLSDAKGKILAVNAAYCRMVEMKEEDLLGKPVSCVEAKEKRERILRNYRDRFRTGEIRIRREARTRLWNGKGVWFEVADSRLEIPGDPPLLLSLFHDIEHRKKAEAELAELHRQVVEASRQAGMAEIATNVLHNVGNVLNSVNVSANLLIDNICQSRVSGLPKLVALLREHDDDLGAFMASERGGKLVAYLEQLSGFLESEHRTNTGELQSLQVNIEHIKEIVTMQQSYARVADIQDTVNLADLVEDSLRLNAGALARHHVEIVREFRDSPMLTVEKHKVLQILVNLIRNAKHACDDSEKPDKQVTVGIEAEMSFVRIFIKDNGVGIRPENMNRIFNHGFTTRKNGHGFGLHASALAAREIGGKLTARSDGPGKGATFTLEIPLSTPHSLSSGNRPPAADAEPRTGASNDIAGGGNGNSQNHETESLS